jgi:hypothetical protein
MAWEDTWIVFCNPRGADCERTLRRERFRIADLTPSIAPYPQSTRRLVLHQPPARKNFASFFAVHKFTQVVAATTASLVSTFAGFPVGTVPRSVAPSRCNPC